MKVKYYPKSDVLNAHLGYSNSYRWRSIWSAKSLVKEGIICRVGNSKSIDIWRDPWIADEKGRFIESYEVENLSVVGDLINFNTMEWRVELIDQYFTKRDVNVSLLSLLELVEV